MDKKNKKDSVQTWLSILAIAASFAVSGASMVNWSYSTFDTKAQALERKKDTNTRLGRIEGKLDLLINRELDKIPSGP